MAPGWHTEELDEEWPLSPSPSPPPAAAAAAQSTSTKSEPPKAPSKPTGFLRKDGAGTTKVVQNDDDTSSDGGMIGAGAGLKKSSNEKHAGHGEVDSLSKNPAAGTTNSQPRPASPPSPVQGGTFIEKESQKQILQVNPFTPKGPSSAPGFRDFFTPLALESMFTPPPPRSDKSATPGVFTPDGAKNTSSSPPPVVILTPPPLSPPKSSPVTAPFNQAPSQPSRLRMTSLPPEDENSADEIVSTDLPNLGNFNGRVPSTEFTFHAPRSITSLVTSQKRSTPVTPGTKLKLFQTDYDTMTRDALSEMVDNMATAGDASGSSGSSPRSRSLSDEDDEASPFRRSSKRLKLTPPPPPQPRAASSPNSRSVSSGSVRKIGSSTKNRDWLKESDEYMAKLRQTQKRFFSDGSTTSNTGGDESEDVVGTVKSIQGINALEESWGASYPNSLPPTPPLINPSLPSTKLNESPYVREAAAILGRREGAAAPLRRVSNDLPVRNQVIGIPRVASRVAEEATDGKENTARRRATSPTRTLLRRLSSSDEVKAIKLEGATSSSATGLSAIRSRIGPPLRPSSQQSLSTTQLETQKSASTNSGESVVRLPPRTTSSSTQKPTAGPSSAEDLNRFVSSSTVATVTYTTASFKKHPGLPPASKLIHVPFSTGSSVPTAVGGMVFDPKELKWKPAPKTVGVGVVEEEEDVFEGMSGSNGSTSRSESVDKSVVAETTPTDEGDATVLIDHPPENRLLSSTSSLSSNGSAGSIRSGLTPRRSLQRTTSFNSTHFEDAAEVDGEELTENLVNQTFVVDAPAPPQPQEKSTPLPPRNPAVKRLSNAGDPNSNIRQPFITPISVLKKRFSDDDGAVRNSLGTPGSSHRRSVSFSDGRKTGKILVVEHEEADEDEENVNTEFSIKSGGLSMRTRRINGMLEDLEELSADETDEVDHTATPSKLSKSSVRQLSSSSFTTTALEQSTLSTGPANILNKSSKSFHYPGRRGNPGDQTFMTEASFGVAKDRLMEALVDVYFSEPDWMGLKKVDLSGKGLESVARFKEELPVVEEANLHVHVSMNSTHSFTDLDFRPLSRERNMLSYLTGLSKTMLHLNVAHNRLTEVSSMAHLPKIEYLDISHNCLSDVKALSSLTKLRELRIGHNRIESLAPLYKLTNLVHLSAPENQITSVEFEKSKWGGSLETLNLSGNRVRSVDSCGLEGMVVLKSLTLDNNNLTSLQITTPISSLKVLRMDSNMLESIDLTKLPNLERFYADNNRINQVRTLGRRSKVMRLSLRNQEGGEELHLTTESIYSVQNLYLSGTLLPSTIFVPTSSPSSSACLNLNYLELIACKLSSIPSTFSMTSPNLRNLNLNYNYLKEISNLKGLDRLKRLSVVGARLDGTREVMDTLKRLRSLEMVDLRMNPCTLGLYLPILISSSDTNLATSTAAAAPTSSIASQATAASTNHSPSSWASLDAAFRRSLPHEWYYRRMGHRLLVMKGCPGVTVIDGIEVTESERKKTLEWGRVVVEMIGSS